ncbi:MAG: leucyl aminopeptidase family protein [Pseudomonadota bacterium]
MTAERFRLAKDGEAVPLHAVAQSDLKEWREKAPGPWNAWLDTTDFKASEGAWTNLPGTDGGSEAVLVGLGKSPSLWSLGRLSGQLPAKTYRLDIFEGALDPDDAVLGWVLGAYRYAAAKAVQKEEAKAQLLWPDGANEKLVTAIAEATYLVRDLINRPANDLTTVALGQAARHLAESHGAGFTEIVGDDLLDAGYPAIHVVGRASENPPRLIDITWGDETKPKLTIVGKGIVFDTGGLDLKPSSNMRLMKKDMGGAAHALGLAHLIMAMGLDVRLRVFVPTAENSVSSRSYRPSDVIDTRKGITVEVGNTDAEGRLVLSDALHEAAGERPEVLIDFATLTGAARVALGTELPALFCNDDGLAADILEGGLAATDPLWRLPLHEAYRRHLKTPFADISSTGEVPMGGAITAALFLERFVEPSCPWAHIDLMAWNSGEQPGRPKGGEAMGMRGVFSALQKRFGGRS